MAGTAGAGVALGYDTIIAIAIIYSPIIIISLLGLVGNILSIIVWTRPQMKSSTAFLMTSLAAIDIIIFLSTIIGFSWPIIVIFLKCYSNEPMINYYLKVILPYLTSWGYPVNITAETASSYLSLIITLERYVAVCHPFLYKSVKSYYRPSIAAAIVITVSILYNLVKFLEYELVAQHDSHGNVVEVISRTSEWIPDLSPYSGWVDLFFRYLIPLASMIGFNSAVSLELKKATEARQSIGGTLKRDNRLYIMLMYVVGEFLMCNSLNLFYTLCGLLSDGICTTSEGNYQVIATAQYFFITFNSSVNFVTYMVFSKPFKRAFIKTFFNKESSTPREP